MAHQNNPTAHVRGQGTSPKQRPLQNGGSGPEVESFAFKHPSKIVAALVEDIHINDGVIHQVLPDPRKVNQRGDIMERELSSWSNTRQHQDLQTTVSCGSAECKRSLT